MTDTKDLAKLALEEDYSNMSADQIAEIVGDNSVHEYFRELPLGLVDNLLCFEKFNIKVNLRELTRKQRQALLKSLAPQACKPSPTNYWIWFGSYTAKGTPIYHNVPVGRVLFSKLIGDPGSSRVRRSIRSHKSDVNPFKLITEKKALNVVGRNAQYLAQSNTPNAKAYEEFVEQDINDCARFMRDIYIEGEIDTVEKVVEVMNQDYPKEVITKALAQVTDLYKPAK